MAAKGYHTRKKIYKIEHLEIASIKENDIPSDVLERIEGYEVMTESSGEMDPMREKNIYDVSTIQRLAKKSKDNDTNETTRLKLVDLYFSINNYDYLMIIK